MKSSPVVNSVHHAKPADIVVKIAAAKKRADVAKKAVQEAKASFKKSRKAYKLAKKTAKAVKRQIKELKMDRLAAKAASSKAAEAKKRKPKSAHKTVVAIKPIVAPIDSLSTPPLLENLSDLQEIRNDPS